MELTVEVSCGALTGFLFLSVLFELRGNHGKREKERRWFLWPTLLALIVNAVRAYDVCIVYYAGAWRVFLLFLT